jgi:hypothetical protein
MDEPLLDLTGLKGEEVLVIAAAVHAFKHHHRFPNVQEICHDLQKRLVATVDAIPEDDKWTSHDDVMKACEVAMNCNFQTAVGEAALLLMTAMLGPGLNAKNN